MYIYTHTYICVPFLLCTGLNRCITENTFSKISVPFLRGDIRAIQSEAIHESMQAEFLNENFQAPSFHIKSTTKISECLP